MYAPRIIRRRFHWPTALVVLGVVVVVAGSLAAAVYLGSNQWPLPASIRAQVHFPVFVPSVGVKLNQSSYRYDRASGVLSFTGRLYDGQTVTFAEQATPDPFNDIPNYTTQFLQTLFEYQAFDCVQGTVHLTRPKDAGQAAVMNAKGTLLFARVARDENKPTWRRVFNGLTVYQPK